MPADRSRHLMIQRVLWAVGEARRRRQGSEAARGDPGAVGRDQDHEDERRSRDARRKKG